MITAVIGATAEIVRRFQPSIVIFTEIDMGAMEGCLSPEHLPLDALDGDANVAVVIITNRVTVVERSSAKGLTRRGVLLAASEGREHDDQHAAGCAVGAA